MTYYILIRIYHSKWYRGDWLEWITKAMGISSGILMNGTSFSFIRIINNSKTLYLPLQLILVVRVTSTLTNQSWSSSALNIFINNSWIFPLFIISCTFRSLLRKSCSKLKKSKILRQMINQMIIINNI